MGFIGDLLEDVTGKSKRPEIKGSRFESFVSKEVFTDMLFDLVETTRDFDSNKERFEERSMNPDFLFRDKRTKEEFWVEAKYRNGLFKNNRGQLVCEICKPWQLDRYKEVEKTSGKKVYICLGIGEDPKYPETVHLIPVSEAYPQLFQSKLKETLLWRDQNI
ncbi:MAG: hypothetical protein Q8J68_13970 [Methanolobus sp.]|uniref:hypothetical protein n=1 Tax=Methanolobus sp. TaxID=1874737 RepID=UPI002731A047|nr:hypothetical protein [Methanolobus sp.]MDP2218380.1 hypothetical protein [Methanolobus sp.]